MGVRQSKFEEDYLPGTPLTVQALTVQRIYGAETTTISNVDPRSPNGVRTPISLPSQRVCTDGQLVPVDALEQKTNSEKPFDLLKKRLLRGFTNNDPRSPSLNRTPLVFDDSCDRTLDLDDTFADLFIESEPVMKPALQPEDTEMPESAESTNDTEVSLDKSSTVEQQKIDPRSPSIGVERTPIILCDDDHDINEDAFLENILSSLTLNLNLSADSSFVSLKSTDAPNTTESEKNTVPKKPNNKHLDRVRLAKKTITRGPHRKLRQKIYQDCENQIPLSPPIKSNHLEKIGQSKEPRTPLSCMKNRSHLRSRSVESSEKSVKAQFKIKSFDDTLTLNDNKNVNKIRILCDEDHCKV